MGGEGGGWVERFRGGWGLGRGWMGCDLQRVEVVAHHNGDFSRMKEEG